jgi:hypothetical protein
MYSTPYGNEPRMGLNPKWTQSRMNSTPNGLNPKWTTPNGLNPEGTEPRMD